MPYSGFVFDSVVKETLKDNMYEKYLDIGCGAGKYARIIHDAVPNPYIVGVEVSENYIDKFNLNKYYNEIHCNDALSFCKDNLDFTTEFIMIGDCIEHLWKSDGKDIIDFLIYRSKKIVIIFPSELVQFGDADNPGEHHISVWSEYDFKNFNYQYIKKGCMNIAILEGYL